MTDEEFPYPNFLFKLEYVDNKSKKICWFETEHHRKSHIKRHNLKPKEIVTKNG